jgi:uncharacterized protein YjbI with pentapeptide repeats
VRANFAHLSNPSNFKQPEINQTALLLSVLMSQTLSQNQERQARQNRLIYRSRYGKNNKITGSINREKVSKEEILSRKILSPHPYQLSSQELKQEIDKQKANGDLIQNIDFSNNDLSGFNFNNLRFSNCNFSNCKMPSMSFVSIDNDCILENSDWSFTTQNFVRFGNDKSRDKAVELTSLMAGHQLHRNNISTFDDFGEINAVRIELDKKTHDETTKLIEEISDNKEDRQPLLNVRSANFKGVNFQTFVVYDGDFAGSDFSDAKFRINQGNRGSQTSFILQNAQNIDLHDSSFEFFDNQGVKISESKGSKPMTFSLIDENQKGLYASSGVVSQEYRDLIGDAKKIIIKVNADIDKIPQGLRYQSISDKVRTSPLMDKEKISEVEKIAIEIGNNFLGRFNFEFVSDKDLQGKEADFIFHINVVDGIGSAIADNTEVFTLGAKESFVALDQIEFRDDFEKTLAHEMGHVFLFQHPMGNADLKVPALMSYAIPFVKTEEIKEQSQGNILPIMNFTPIELKLLESHMKELGREPKIDKDLEIKIDKKTRGVYSSYNPDKNFANLVDISAMNFDDEMNLVIMDAKNALAFCQTKCDYAIGLDEDKAVMMISKKTGIIHAMAILSGENPKLKISDEIVVDLNDLYKKNGHSIIDKDSKGDLIVQEFLENKKIDSRLLPSKASNQYLSLESAKKEDQSIFYGLAISGIVALSALAIKTKQTISKSTSQSEKSGKDEHYL